MTDVIVVTKADGFPAAATTTATELMASLRMVRRKHEDWPTRVIPISAGDLNLSLEDRGVVRAWDAITALYHHLASTGALEARRTEQRIAWMRQIFHDELMDRALVRDPGVRQVKDDVEARVRGGSLSPASAADRMLAAFIASTRENEE